VSKKRSKVEKRIVYNRFIWGHNNRGATCTPSQHGHHIGGLKTPTYATWQNMLRRVRNPNAHDYAGYGGRGIRVCSRWMSFANFLEDMGCKPEGMQLHRIDHDGNY